jgi:hypothetical protein
MSKYRLFIYFFSAGSLTGFVILWMMFRPTYPHIEATTLPELVALALLAGLCAGVWASIIRGQNFGPLKGVLTALLALVSFSTIFAAIIGKDMLSMDTLYRGVVFTLWGGMFFGWILLPVGFVTGALYRKMVGGLQPSGKREYIWAVALIGVSPIAYATVWLNDYDARVYEVPAGFSGTICVEFDNPACPLEKRFFEHYVIKVDANGRGCTSAPFRYSSSRDELHEVVGNEQTLIPASRLRYQTTSELVGPRSQRNACAPKDADPYRASKFLRMEVVPTAK